MESPTAYFFFVPSLFRSPDSRTATKSVMLIQPSNTKFPLYARPIILVFQGSDWCAPCIKLDREIWSTEVFKKYATENYVMLQADFPRRKKNALPEPQTKANAALAEKYNKQGYFPFVVVLDSNGKVLGESSYKKTTPENYIKELNAFRK